ncbi:hypothetical protein AB4Z22_01475 [Paenibacillus sp. TAF58]
MVFLPSFAIGNGIRHIGVVFVVQAAALALSRFIVGPWTARMGHRFVISVNLLGLGIVLAGINFSTPHSILDFGIGAGASGWGILSDFFEMRWIFLLAGSLMIVAISAFAYMERSRRTNPGIKI